MTLWKLRQTIHGEKCTSNSSKASWSFCAAAVSGGLSCLIPGSGFCEPLLSCLRPNIFAFSLLAFKISGSCGFASRGPSSSKISPLSLVSKGGASSVGLLCLTGLIENSSDGANSNSASNLLRFAAWNNNLKLNAFGVRLHERGFFLKICSGCRDQFPANLSQLDNIQTLVRSLGYHYQNAAMQKKKLLSSLSIYPPCCSWSCSVVRQRHKTIKSYLG